MPRLIDPPVSASVVQIYSPAAVGTPTVFVFNTGTSSVYIGGSNVTFATGLQLLPGQQLEFPNYPYGIWAVCNPGTTGTSTTLSAAAAQAGTSVTVGATSGYSAGQVLQVGTASAAETVVVSTVPNGTTVTFTTGLRWAHASGETLALVNASAGSSLNVMAGTR